MRLMRKRTVILVFSFIGLLCLAVLAVLVVPGIRERVTWRVVNLDSQVRRILNPPEQVVFIPEGGGDPDALATIVQATIDVLLPSATPDLNETSNSVMTTPEDDGPTGTPEPTQSPTLVPTSTPTATPIPESVVLSGVLHEYQQFNNCGPANLSMALSFWDWQGDQRDTRAFLRPNLDVDDKNVMPSEMVTYVQEYTELKAITRLGGDLELLKRFIAAGFPVIIEAGHHPPDDWWMGHFLVVNGYDDARQRFVTQDSLIMPDFPTPYDELVLHWWRDFNYVYVVIYPMEREDEVMSILGPNSDPTYNLEYTAEKARSEIPLLSGRDLYFAWFNLGASLVGLEDYTAAAEAFDQAFAIYQHLSEDDRPYRMMWYRVEPYAAYYYSGRYQDVINLANTTFTWVGKSVLEESFYWRGMAYEALGDADRAISDYQKAAELNPNYLPPQDALQRLGVQAP
jgi:hypothetical protein